MSQLSQTNPRDELRHAQSCRKQRLTLSVIHWGQSPAKIDVPWRKAGKSAKFRVGAKFQNEVYDKLRVASIQKKQLDLFSRFDRAPTFDSQTDTRL